MQFLVYHPSHRQKYFVTQGPGEVPMESMAGVSMLAMEHGSWSCSQLIKVQKQELHVTAVLKHGADLLPVAHKACHAGVNGNDLC